MKNYFILFGLAGLLFSCMGPLENVQDPGNGGTDTLVVTTPFSLQTNGEYQFTTNDAALLGAKGTTVVSPSSTTFAAFTGFEAKVRKTSGNNFGAYGLVWNRQAANRFWFADIDNTGYFLLGKVYDGKVYYLNATIWTYSNVLLRGTGVVNTIKVTYTSGPHEAESPGSGTYTLYLNGYESETFQDLDMGAVLSSGNVGFNAVLQANEVFPSTPVTVYFEPLTPGVQW